MNLIDMAKDRLEEVLFEAILEDILGNDGLWNRGINWDQAFCTRW